MGKYGIGLQVGYWMFEQLNAGEFLSRIYDKNMAIGCAKIKFIWSWETKIDKLYIAGSTLSELTRFGYIQA